MILSQYQFNSVAQSCPPLCDPMDCSTPGFRVYRPTPGVYSNSCPSSRWRHPTISSSVIPFSSCLQPFPASGYFPMSQCFVSGGQSIVSISVTQIFKILLEYNWSTICISFCCTTKWISYHVGSHESSILPIVVCMFQSPSPRFSLHLPTDNRKSVFYTVILFLFWAHLYHFLLRSHL